MGFGCGFVAGSKDLAHHGRVKSEFVKLLPGVAVGIFQAQGERAQRTFFSKVLLP